MKKNKKEAQHEYNLVTGYCIYCGLSITHSEDPPYKCHRTPNVTSIAHKVRPNVLRTPTKYHNPRSK